MEKIVVPTIFLRVWHPMIPTGLEPATSTLSRLLTLNYITVSNLVNVGTVGFLNGLTGYTCSLC